MSDIRRERGFDTRGLSSNIKGEFYIHAEWGGALLDVGESMDELPETVQLRAEEFIKKEEFHVTFVGDIRQLYGFVDVDAEDEDSVEAGRAQIKDAMTQAADGLVFDISLKDEFKVVRREERRTIVQMCDVSAMDEFYSRLEGLLGIPEQTIERPPAHITLYTGEDGKGIGLFTQEHVDDLAEDIPAEEVLKLIR